MLLSRLKPLTSPPRVPLKRADEPSAGPFFPFASEDTTSEGTAFSDKNKIPVHSKLNDRVEHEKFESGTVNAIIGSGESQALQIQFAPLWGTRTIVTKYVRLLEQEGIEQVHPLKPLHLT